MPEPSVSEILNINADPERGTGEPAVVYDNSQVLSLLNQNARANQENQWRRYNRFLNDYQEKLKTRQDIADLAVADSDREYLKSQATELFKTALDNPTAIYSPEFNSKLGEIKSNATSSKLARDFAEKNLQWMAINPELNTDENKEKVLDYIDGQTVDGGGRATFTLDMPDVFDYQKYFSGVKDLNKEMINANRVDEKQELIFQRQDKKFKYDPFIKSVEVGYDSNKQIQKRAQKDFNSLPPELKRQFEDAKDYWVNLGSKYFGSPQYTDIIEQGEEIIKPYNAPGERADRALKRAQLALGWSELEWKKEKDRLAALGDKEQKTWLNDFVAGSVGNALNNGKRIFSISNENGQTTVLRKMDVSTPLLKLFAYTEKDRDGKDVTKLPDDAAVTEDGRTVVFNYYTGKKDKSGNPYYDASKTKKVSLEEFKARTGKDMLGVKALSEEIYPYGTQPEADAGKPAWAE